ncbi:MAG TPA: hypothetical protein VGM09_13695, partial [Bradyrhizobium sp.]
MPVGVEHGLQKSPAGEAHQTGGERPKKISAEWPLKSKLQCVTGALRMRTEPARGEKRDTANKQKDNATRAVAEPHHPDQWTARQMPRLDSRWRRVWHGEINRDLPRGDIPRFVRHSKCGSTQHRKRVSPTGSA